MFCIFCLMFYILISLVIFFMLRHWDIIYIYHVHTTHKTVYYQGNQGTGEPEFNWYLCIYLIKYMYSFEIKDINISDIHLLKIRLTKQFKKLYFINYELFFILLDSLECFLEWIFFILFSWRESMKHHTLFFQSQYLFLVLCSGRESM